MVMTKPCGSKIQRVPELFGVATTPTDVEDEAYHVLVATPTATEQLRDRLAYTAASEFTPAGRLPIIWLSRESAWRLTWGIYGYEFGPMAVDTPDPK